MELLYALFNLTNDDADDINSWLFDCNIVIQDVVEFIQDQLEELDRYPWQINLKSLIFEYILNTADVSELIEYIDISSDTIITATEKQIRYALLNVLPDDRNDSWLFLVEFFGIDVDIKETW